jgi:site-specific DNA-methyltransferase (adenine-specific)
MSASPPHPSGTYAPFYDKNGITIYHGDLRDLWPIEADVIVTDPPYGVGYVSRSGAEPTAPIAGDRNTALRDWMLEAWGDRPALVFGTWKAGRPQARALLVWDKMLGPGMGDLSMPWGPGSEEIYVRGKGWVKAGKRQTNVLRFQGYAAGNRERPAHPTPKPPDLMRHLLERCPSGVVLDPFMGSGATLVAAKELGREAIGVELEETYCQLTVDRLEAM